MQSTTPQFPVDHAWVAHRDALLRTAAAGDRRAREAVLIANLPLIRHVAARYRGLGLPFDDLVQEGSLGLLEAIDAFDPDRGTEFATYARFRVRRAIRNALTERSRLVRLPKHVVERRRLLEDERMRTFVATGHTPTPAELAAQTGLPLSTILASLDAAIDAVSLDASVVAGGARLEELVADPATPDPERTVVEHDSVQRIDEAVERLPERQRCIVEHTFGFDGPSETITEVAAELSLSPQRTRSIVIAALRSLRDELEPLTK